MAPVVCCRRAALVNDITILLRESYLCISPGLLCVGLQLARSAGWSVISVATRLQLLYPPPLPLVTCDCGLHSRAFLVRTQLPLANFGAVKSLQLCEPNDACFTYFIPAFEWRVMRKLGANKNALEFSVLMNQEILQKKIMSPVVGS